MKKFLYYVVACCLAVSHISCAKDNGSDAAGTTPATPGGQADDVMVVYFSQTGTTEGVARHIAYITGAGTWRIEVEQWIKSMETATDEDNNINYSKMNIKVNGRTLTATMADNSSARALIDLLKEGDIVIDMSDYGNFEKVGSLGHTLPQNNENITTEAGDLILYQGNNFVIYYDTNTWNFTRLGKIDGISNAELKELLGKGNVTVTLSARK